MTLVFLFRFVCLSILTAEPFCTENFPKTFTNFPSLIYIYIYIYYFFSFLFINRLHILVYLLSKGRKFCNHLVSWPSSHVILVTFSSYPIHFSSREMKCWDCIPLLFFSCFSQQINTTRKLVKMYMNNLLYAMPLINGREKHCWQ